MRAADAVVAALEIVVMVMVFYLFSGSCVSKCECVVFVHSEFGNFSS